MEVSQFKRLILITLPRFFNSRTVMPETYIFVQKFRILFHISLGVFGVPQFHHLKNRKRKGYCVNASDY